MTRITLTVESAEEGQRLDQVLARRLQPVSRSRLQKWVKAGLVRVNEGSQPVDYRVRGGDRLSLEIPEPQKPDLPPEPIPLAVVYEDRELIVINKPPGLVVHPGAGHQTGTLVHALIHHCPDLTGIGDVQRPGLVHRLDKDTSGILVVAKTEAAHQALVSQFKGRQVRKLYVALAWGHFPESHGEIVTAVGRHPRERHKMSVHARRGREARTSWRRLQEYPGPLSLLEVELHTGRTHQIRVHLAALGHPVVGDQTYGGGARRLASLPAALQELKPLVQRQLLHAWKLDFTHPRRGDRLCLEAPLPSDFQAVVDFLELAATCSR